MVKQFAAALVAGVMVFGIAGCGSSNSLTSKDASTEGSRKTPPAPQPSVTGTPNAPQTPKPTKSAEPEQTEDEPFVQVSGLPKSFPKALPLPKGGTVTAGTRTLEGWTVEFKGVSSASHTALRKQIESDGGTKTFGTESGDLHHVQYEMPKYTVQFLWVPKARGNETSLVYTVTKKSD